MAKWVAPFRRKGATVLQYLCKPKLIVLFYLVHIFPWWGFKGACPLIKLK